MDRGGHCAHCACGGDGGDTSPSSKMYFFIRIGTVLLTVISVFMMGFAMEHLHCTGAFIYFIISNAVVFLYSVAALAAGANPSYDDDSGTWLLPMVDMVVAAVLLTSFGAACAVIFAISSFALLVSIAIAMTLLSSIAYVLLFAHGIVAIHTPQDAAA